jgi:signal transduction histidine kinase
MTSNSPQQKIQQLERLVEVNRILSSTLELPKLLEALADTASELTMSETASILLYDSKKNELKFEAIPGRSTAINNLSVPIDSSAAGWVLTNNRPLVIQDAANDPRICRSVDQALNFTTKSLIAVPLQVKQKPIGVLEAVNKKNNHHYTEDDINLLENLGCQAAIAIENARMVEELRMANSEMMRHTKVKSDFIAIASHELRTPLGLILGHATFLKEYIPDQHQEQIEVIIRSAMRLKTIIEDLSTIAHKEQGQSRIRRAPFSISEMVASTSAQFQAEADKKKIELGFDVPVEELMLEGDKEKIQIILTNLVRNALTFTDAGGQIGIKAEKDSGYIKVYVVDTGVGIPEEEQNRIFERFYQVESHLTRRHGGMGLGLSIAKGMVELHNGQIWVESKVGMGSLFCFMLPVNQKKADAAARVFRSV